MVVTDAEIDRMAREMIAKYGKRAAQQAIQRLNEMIDRGNVRGRDIWACIVHEIHERDGSGPAWSPGLPHWHNSPAELDRAFGGVPLAA